MNVQVEKLEGNMAKITVTLDAEKTAEGIEKAYQKIKNQVTLPGFRKGKVPKFMIEKNYGVEVFYEDASDFLMNESYPLAYDEAMKEVEIVSQPKITDIKIEKGEPFVYVAEVATKPEVKLGEYKGIEYAKADVSVAEEDVDKEIERTRELNSRQVPVEDRPAKEGDIVDIDFEGSVDGQTFDGGKATGYTLTLGSHSFIDTFEEQIAGHNIGDEFDVNVTFPEDYQAADLASKAAVFKCKLNGIKFKELPELDDEFASEVSEFDTLDEYKADVKKNMEERKAENAKAEAQKEILKKVVANSEMEIPELMLDAQANQVAQDFAMRMQSQGIALEQYLQLVGQTPETFMQEVRPRALQQTKERLVLEAIAAAENIQPTDEDIETELKKMADMYGMDVEKAKELMADQEKDQMRKDLAVSKAADFLYENGKAVEVKEEPKEEVKEEPKAEEKAE